MLKFVHADSSKDLTWHRWPFVYFHGEAERLNSEVYSNGGEAPDICMASESMDTYIPCIGNDLPCKSWSGTVTIPCFVNGEPAVCVLSTQRFSDGLFGGRIALVRDLIALRHVLHPKDWR